jgi:hypothetical protein
MNEQPSAPKTPRNAASWAKPVDTLSVGDVSADAINLNVTGKRVTGPLQGFGQLWQKTYKIRLGNIQTTPAAVVQQWKATLPELMPANSRFYPSMTGVKPGEVILINATMPGVPGTISTGVMILYADDEAFTVMTPEGHPESGFNTFSAYEADGAVVAQIQSLARANDPIYEFGFRFMGGSQEQEKIWHHVLTGLAGQLGAKGEVDIEKTCVDSRLQWAWAKNIWHNAMIRSTMNLPVRFVQNIFKGKGA